MNKPKRLITAVGLLLLGASAALQAAPQDHGQGPNDDRGNSHQAGHAKPDNRQGHQPPKDFGPVRQIIRDDRQHFSRGAPPPPNVRIVRGQPLPRGYYGERLQGPALARLPVYRGYEWRRMGNDVVLVAIGTGVVYEILDGVLN